MTHDEVKEFLEKQYIPSVEDKEVKEVLKRYLTRYLLTYKTEEETLKQFIVTYQSCITSFISFVYGKTDE